MENKRSSQCVFVRLGIISFKICRKNFNCSQCELARTILDFGSLTNEFSERARMIEQLRQLIKNREEEAKLQACQQGSNMMPASRGMDIPTDRFYHHAHIWLLPLSNRRFRLGLDEIAQFLLQTITGIQVSGDKSRGGIAWDFCCMGRMVQIPCPLKGRLAEVNNDVLMDPPRIHEDPYEKGWLSELELKKNADFSQLLRGEEARAWMAMEMERIRRFDATVMDGGELVHNPAKWISEQEWRNLLDVFIIQPAKKKFL